MLFSYAVRSVYIESCSLFVRGGVYRVVKEAMGGFLGKLSVSALMFDYILTGPTSGVSAGQYICFGLILDSLAIISPELKITDENTRDLIKRDGSVLIACAITVYFFRQNLIGIHESSGKALKIMVATTIMAVIILVWCLVTLVIRHGPVNDVLHMPDLSAKVEYKMAARYQLTRDSFKLMALPEPIVKKLEPLLDKEYPSEKAFVTAWPLTEEEAASYRRPLLTYANRRILQMDKHLLQCRTG